MVFITLLTVPNTYLYSLDATPYPLLALNIYLPIDIRLRFFDFYTPFATSIEYKRSL